MAIPPHMYPPSMSSRAPMSQSCATPHQHQMPTSGSQGSPLMYHTALPTGFSSPQFMMGPQGFGVGHVSSTDRFGIQVCSNAFELSCLLDPWHYHYTQPITTC